MTNTTDTAARAAKFLALFAELFACKVDLDRVRAILFALGLRETCSRCGGSGSYSYCQAHGSTCFKCGGSREFAVPLNTKTLAAARAKVEAGELVALRVVWAERAAARKAIAPLVANGCEVYGLIGAAYTTASMARANLCYYTDDRGKVCAHPIARAQEMNNALRDRIWQAERDVKSGKVGAHAGLAVVTECVAMLETLRAAWLAFAAA